MVCAGATGCLINETDPPNRPAKVKGLAWCIRASGSQIEHGGQAVRKIKAGLVHDQFVKLRKQA